MGSWFMKSCAQVFGVIPVKAGIREFRDDHTELGLGRNRRPDTVSR